MNYQIINDGIVKIIETSLDCERIECIHYGGLGCHGADDPMNQTSCRLDLKDAMECIEGLENEDMSKIKYHSMHREVTAKS